MTEHRITYVTAPVEVAEQIARTLVEDELAMCVNIIEHIRSIYRWEGHVEVATESLLIVKAPVEKTDLLIEKVREIHPYEVPEVLSMDIAAGNKDYLDWLAGKEIVIEEPDLDEDLDIENLDEEAKNTEEKEETEA